MKKQAYWNVIRCEQLADVYEKWRQNKEGNLPRKCRLKPIDNKPEDDSLFRLRVPKYGAKYENYDQVIHDEIANISHDDMQIKLRGLWENETNQEKIKSTSYKTKMDRRLWKSNDEKS